MSNLSFLRNTYSDALIIKIRVLVFNGTLTPLVSVENKFTKYLQNLVKTIKIKTVHKIYKK